ncbi:actin-like protein, putative [Bodo saltans]|uniref:Actin-like protein, putative n=1 Tax=Bodo saltans TaxID=75058 RepID=A0A0S4KM34_BODSA|nr:actin-like protein, putative [Bodo saltans]|eukprot:CUI15563.1 actin-like protein, putative [Bodo saltans]
MSVIDAGSFAVRCGSIGEATSSMSLAPFSYNGMSNDNEEDSVLLHHRSRWTASSRRYTWNQLLTDPRVDVERSVPLWTTESIQNHLPEHVEQLSYIASKALGFRSADPLMLVLQEAWHERLERVSALASALLEGEITSALYFARPSVCIALSQGKPTAVVVDCGHSQTTAAVVCDGYVARRSIITAPVAGSAVTSTLLHHISLPYERTLSSRCLDASAAHPKRIALARFFAMQEVKEVWAVVGGGVDGGKGASGGVSAPTEPAMQRFFAPDGAELHLSDDATRSGLDVARLRDSCFDQLFRESTHAPGEHAQSIHIPKTILKVRRNVDIEMRAATLPHILGGGTSQAPRFAARVTAELKTLDSQYFKAPPPIVASANSAWKGASMSAESSAFMPLWITKAELAEEGTSVLRRKLCY